MNEKRRRLLVLLLSGEYSYTEVAKIAGLKYGDVAGFHRRWKYRYELPPAKRGRVGIPKKKKKSVLRDNLKEAYEVYKGGKSLDDVGKIYGNIGREAVRQMFKKHGLETRGKNAKVVEVSEVQKI